MATEPILIGKVLWSYDHEVLQRDVHAEFGAQFSGVLPFHKHSGEIALTRERILIIGDSDLEIPLTAIEQIYLGFDVIFPATLVKNFGLFWQPLRISLSNGQHIYLVIDYHFWGAKNQQWFAKLKEILSN